MSHLYWFFSLCTVYCIPLCSKYLSFYLFLVFTEVSEFMHACEGDAVTKALTDKKVPFFNAPIYLQNKTQIGKVDEIFGAINDFVSSVVASYCC